MHNMSMLRHRFSNEQWGGGGGGLNHLPLLFGKSVYILVTAKARSSPLMMVVYIEHGEKF